MDLRSQVGQVWLDEVEKYNVNRLTGDFIKVHLRVPAQGRLQELRLTNPTAYADLVNIPTSIRECDGRLNDALPDLGNPTIRRYIGLFTQQVITGAKTRLPSGRTKIQEVTLVMDSAGESSIWGDEAGNSSCTNQVPFSSFSNARYPHGQAFRERANYFYQREIPLKQTYREFASAVTKADAAIKPAVFLQTWAMDGRMRGSFDLYELVKGTGVKVIHHTTFPNLGPGGGYLTQEQHRITTAYTATIAAKSGLEFDTEFSWAHYAPAGSAASFPWTGSIPPDLNTMVPGNAQSFFRQAVAGFKFGATGMAYCNWAMQSINFPPYTSGTTFTHPDWVKMIGHNINSQTASSTHLTVGGGLLTSTNTTALPAASKAVYISTLGRLDCEESGSCLGVGVLWGWFNYFGLTAEVNSRKVDIITDGMVRDGKVNWDSYAYVYVPFQTSNYTESAVLDILKRLPQANKDKFYFQQTSTDPGTGNFNQFLTRTKPFLVHSIVPLITPVGN